MRYRNLFKAFPLLLLAAGLLVSACAAPAGSQPTAGPTALQPTTAPTTPPVESPTPLKTAVAVETKAPGTFTDPDEFIPALLQAITAQDRATLEGWMTTPFINGGWRADVSDSAPVDALNYLFSDYIGTDNHLEVVKDADLSALMGDTDPLSIVRPEAGVFETILVSGWGKESRDEAILYIARASDNTLKWHGWVTIPGGFSGARLGGSQLYTNDAYHYRVFLPKQVEIVETNAEHILIMAPGEGHPGEGRAAAFIDVEPANGRTVQEIVEKAKADAGPGFNFPPGTALGLDKAFALIISGLPGQDPNRQLFAVYNDLLYHITFVPDSPQVGKTYEQMEDLYAMIVNTFHFTD